METQKGYAALTLTLLTIVISLTIIGSFALFSLQEAAVTRALMKSAESRAAAEGGLEDVIYRVSGRKKLSPSEIIGVGAATTTVSVTTAGTERIISSRGIREDYQRNFEARLDIHTANASFFYGAQIGNGGLIMENTSAIQGNVYSNGPITGNNSPTITGDAFAASTSPIRAVTVNGNAHAHEIIDSAVRGYASSTALIENTIVEKDAHAYELKNATVNRDAYYQVSDGATTVLGTRFPGTPPPHDLDPLPMPISDSLLDQWENDAAAGEIITGPCPYTPSHGTSIGPAKIICDVIIDGTNEITLTGTLWITGNFDLKNSAILRVHQSFDDRSAILIADNPSDRTAEGTIIIQNSSQILGSGAAGSYLMLVSRNESAERGGTNTAIDIKNSSAASIYYAPHGKLAIQNNVVLKEATAYQIEMKNSAELVYESGLNDVRFSSGPAAGYDMKYWKEVE